MKYSLYIPFLIVSMNAAAYAASDGLTREQILEVMQKNMGQVVGCYEPELERNPKLTGRVTISFDIGSEGQVLNSAILKTTLQNKKVEYCIIQANKSWSFPKPTGSKAVHVDYPFELRKVKKSSLNNGQ